MFQLFLTSPSYNISDSLILSRVGFIFFQFTSSFILLVSFYDPGPHGNFRYSKNMLPKVSENNFRKGSQVSLQSSLLYLYTKLMFYTLLSFLRNTFLKITIVDSVIINIDFRHGKYVLASFLNSCIKWCSPKNNLTINFAYYFMLPFTIYSLLDFV